MTTTTQYEYLLNEFVLTKFCGSFAFFSVLLSRFFGNALCSCFSSLKNLPFLVNSFDEDHLVAVIKEDTGSMAELFTAGLAHLQKNKLDIDELITKMISIMMMTKHVDPSQE